MKKLFLLFALFGVLAVGCEELFPTEQSSNTTPIFRIDGEGEYIVGVKGEEIAVMVTTNIDYSVVIPEDAKDWVSVAYTRSDTREEILVFVVARNDNFEERRAEVELVDANGEALETLSFVQDGLSKIFETNSEEFYFFEPEGSSVTIDVTTNLEYSVVIDQDVQSWLSVADTRATLREETLTFTATPNDTDKLRYAFVKLVDADKSILQEIPFLQNAITQSDASCPNDEIWYTTTDGNALTLNEKSQFNVSVLSNTYIDGKGVIKFDGDLTEIGVESFYNCSTLSTVHLPKSLKKSGHLAFGECWNLTGVYIYDLAAWCNIDFENLATDTIYFDANPLCYARDLYLNGELVTDLVIPEGVSEVKLIAFIRCNSITSVTIPDSVTSIDSCAFYECENLAKVTIPDSVTTIGDHVFCLCGSLTDVTIGDSVTMIGDYAFCKCESLTSVTIPDSVTMIGDYAFWDCISLTSVTIPDSVTMIGDYAFWDCISLTSITIPDSVTTIGEWAFGWCESLTSVTIPDSVTEIGYGTFAYCRSLTSITIPDSVTEIGSGAFYECRNLTKVAIGKGVTVIGDGAFQGCYNLNSIYVSDLTAWCNIDFGTATETNPLYNGRNLYLNGSLITDLIIPNGVTEIRQYAFVNCNIRSLIIPDSVTAIRKGAFFNCNNLESITLPNSVTTIEEEVFSGCNSIKEFNGQFASDDGKCIIIDGTLISFTDTGDITEYTVPIGVTKIGDYAFFRCINLINVIIPDSVTTIGDCAFSNCSSLTSITIPDSVTTIGNAAFSACTSLTSITIPDSVTTIGDVAFANCSSLTSVTIPDSVTTIGSDAFAYCYSLTSVTIGNSVTTIGGCAFYNCSSLREFNGKFASEDGRCLIVDGTLNSFAPAGLTEYLIPNCVAVIGSGAFAYCTSLTSVTIPDGVTEIKDHAFFCCDSLTSLSIPDGVTCIGFQTFGGCIGLTSVTIPDSVTEIGDYAFEGCSSLTSVTIGDSVTTIGYEAFEHCSRLTSVYCKAVTPPTGRYGMFDDNAYGRKIYVPTESVEAYKSADGWKNYADDIEGYDF